MPSAPARQHSCYAEGRRLWYRRPRLDKPYELREQADMRVSCSIRDTVVSDVRMGRSVWISTTGFAYWAWKRYNLAGVDANNSWTVSMYMSHGSMAGRIQEKVFPDEWTWRIHHNKWHERRLSCEGKKKLAKQGYNPIHCSSLCCGSTSVLYCCFETSAK